MIVVMVPMYVRGTAGGCRCDAAGRQVPRKKDSSAFLEVFRQMLGHVGMVVVDESDQPGEEPPGLQPVARDLRDEGECAIQHVHGGLLVQGRRAGILLLCLVTDEGVVFLFQAFGEHGRGPRRDMERAERSS